MIFLLKNSKYLLLYKLLNLKTMHILYNMYLYLDQEMIHLLALLQGPDDPPTGDASLLSGAVTK